MTGPDDDGFICDQCNSETLPDNDFCTHCGALFAEGELCDVHRDRAAEGVCIICALPFCRECAARVIGRFLCNHHSTYEIYEGMVRIHGVLDDVSAQFAETCLGQAGLHPILYCRRQPKGGPRFVYTLYSAGGDYDGHIVNEIKVMVSCREVSRAEKVLRELKILGESTR